MLLSSNNFLRAASVPYRIDEMPLSEARRALFNEVSKGKQAVFNVLVRNFNGVSDEQLWEAEPYLRQLNLMQPMEEINVCILSVSAALRAGVLPVVADDFDSSEDSDDDDESEVTAVTEFDAEENTEDPADPAAGRKF